MAALMNEAVRSLYRRDFRSVPDQNVALSAAFLAICLAVSSSAFADDGNEVWSTYRSGSGVPKYEYTITAEMIDRAPKWDDRTEPNPPLSAADAIGKSRGCIEKIPTGSVSLGPIPENYWTLTGVGLKKVLHGWAWDVSYQLASRGPMSGIWPIMDCWVLMDGTVLTPRASSQGLRLQH